MSLVISEAFIPQLINKSQNKVLTEVALWFSGIFLLSALAQIVIPLPWTPVPITGQTFGVALVGLSWGRKRAFTILLSYLTLGALGLPIFAMGSSGLILGPSSGYLLGMAVASLVVGTLADCGFTKTFPKSLLAAFTGSLVIFAFGLGVLSFFVPKESLLAAGLLPFIPGDIIKNFLAAKISQSLRSL